MKAFVQRQITKKVQKILSVHKPIIVAVTGSVGKTSVRNAIATVLSAKYTVGTTIKNYNNEFGVPLSILGEESPGKSIVGWLRVLIRFPRNVPQVFVLEYGVDHPGDMEHLCQIAQPDVSVLTRISPVHAEHFSSIEALAQEKAQLLAHTKKNGLTLLNQDDKRVKGLAGHAVAPIQTYGYGDGADIQATDYRVETLQDFSFEPGEQFSKVRLSVQTSEGRIVVELNNVLGRGSASAVLPAIAIAQHLGLTHEQILSKIGDIEFEPGRMNPIPGIKGSLLIDSSYNAAPASMTEALNVLSDFHPVEGARRIAVLGHMAELGQYTEQEHRMLGMRAAEVGVDLLVCVGQMTQDTHAGAIDAGIPEDHIQHFDDAVEAGRWLDRQVHKGDIVLIKGSQSARMERVVKDLMAEPLNAEQLLVRQSAYWMKN
ncbi:MAG: UDP-N-acetylmuramoyl-tripeptide--D-alanyl-D-alanine ligase [Parcubacteria group bacterium]|nr:UDP-N-acetylmuramoyl-tripeptide--D-alanyl-D-alanine ligase [Parcubacteria group bacterium]